MKADRGSRIQSATWTFTASTHTERFLSSLIAFISIFRRPIVVIFRYYVAVDTQVHGSQRPSRFGGWLERKEVASLPMVHEETGLP